MTTASLLIWPAPRFARRFAPISTLPSLGCSCCSYPVSRAVRDGTDPRFGGQRGGPTRTQADLSQVVIHAHGEGR